jgi:lysosomal Pro-X carboxypeptidase
LRFLTHEQALADYAVLIYHLKTEFAGGVGAASPVIAFGGSYGWAW